MLMSMQILWTASMAYVLTHLAATSATATRTFSLPQWDQLCRWVHIWQQLSNSGVRITGRAMAWVTLNVNLYGFSCSQHAGQVWAEKSSVVILPSGLDTHGHMHSQFYTCAYLPCPFRNIFNHYIQIHRHIWRHTQLLHIEMHGSSQGQQQKLHIKNYIR